MSDKSPTCGKLFGLFSATFPHLSQSLKNDFSGLKMWISNSRDF